MRHGSGIVIRNWLGCFECIRSGVAKGVMDSKDDNFSFVHYTRVEK